MEILRHYTLPNDFKPVVFLCNEVEKSIFIELNCFAAIKKKDYDNINYNLLHEPEIKDDVDFIVRMQHECDIADETQEEISEWFYTLASIRTLENFQKCSNEYDIYTNSITKESDYIRIKTNIIKDLVLDIYRKYLYSTSFEEIDNLISKIQNSNFIDIENDILWMDSDKKAHIIPAFDDMDKKMVDFIEYMVQITLKREQQLTNMKKKIKKKLKSSS